MRRRWRPRLQLPRAALHGSDHLSCDIRRLRAGACGAAPGGRRLVPSDQLPWVGCIRLLIRLLDARRHILSGQPWYRAPIRAGACDGGDPGGCYTLARLAEDRGDAGEAATQYARACQHGYPPACERDRTGSSRPITVSHW